jgi:hypothetical protein
MHTRTEREQKRFAFLVSAGCTLAIFSVWSFVRFNYSSSTAGTTPQQAALIVATDNLTAPGASRGDTTMVTPFENLLNGIKSSFDAMKSTVSEAGATVSKLGQNLQNEYTDVRNTTIRVNAE